MRNTSTDTGWLEWVEVQKAAVESWFQGGDLPTAVEILTRYLESDPPKDLKREAIAFRGTLYRDNADFINAKSDILSALKLAVARDHVRFELEDTLGALCSELGDVEEADKWYSVALRTAAADPRIAGGGLLLRFLKLRGEKGFTSEEQRLVRIVVYQSWNLLRVKGVPDLDDIEGTAKKLLEAQRGPFSADRPPAPRPFSGSTADT